MPTETNTFTSSTGIQPPLISSPSSFSSVLPTISPSLTSTSTAPGQTPASSDIELLTSRRLDFIVAGAGSPSNISDWLSTLGSDGKWPDSEVDYTAGCPARRANWPAQEHWQRLVTMAAAWHGGLSGADQWVNDSALLAAIHSAMDYWFENDFQNPSCLGSGGTAACPCGTPGLWNTNWFSNVILIPNLVAQSCLLVADNLTDTQHGNCTNITGRSYETFSNNMLSAGILTGANLLDVSRIGIDDGLLNFNTSLVADAYRRIHGEVVVENAVAADGIRADGSFGQHGGVLYNGNYGKDYTNDVLLLEIDAGDTQFAAGPDNRDAFATLMDGSQWMIYRNVLTDVLHWDFSVLGRFISFPVADQQATGSININITEVQQLGEEWDSDTLITVYGRLASPSNDANVGELTGNRMFFANDYMVQRGSGYVTTVKMYSNRTKNSECLNDQNPFGFHLSDGTVYTYMQGDEYEDIAAAWDWNLIPGTSVDYDATPLSCNQVEFTGLNSFVGGVSDSSIGIAAMMYTNPVTEALSWQKAWFFLEDDVQHVMIPIITSTPNASVFSVLDQKRHNGDVFVNGEPSCGQTNFTSPITLWHDSMGYFFYPSPTPWQLSVEAGPKSGNWSDIGISTQGVETVDLFAAWIDHGACDSGVPLSYSVFPAVSQDEFVQKALETPLQVIQNDVDISAVYDPVHRVAMFVFWDIAGGSATFYPSPFEASISVASSANAAVIYRIDSQNVTVSDPSQTLVSLDMTFTVGEFGRKPPRWGSQESKQLCFHLPTGGMAGDSISQIL
ncbi:polysaccharide lyase family 8 protein [Phanerochaete carnosa HHB-10118-sp]|uniref:Polysaccharide lyase family 8 protein n=1 Tax=Phanerochaete carnosa (strain HHB-10118-sp) TaxID=650164 RepID=K5WAP7_PHACS|nr:polysaccharide lyase family 8 protein [Phanerochaete carnosa HHB-10118-sp]EKM61018.1 polysaccharide lyase family 8 protein [Phanerochaete carnosa HHB-10118-sp]